MLSEAKKEYFRKRNILLKTKREKESKARRTKVCIVCGNTFLQPMKAHNKVTCSTECSKKIKNQRKSERRKTLKGREENKTQSKKYYENNKERISERDKQYYQDTGKLKVKTMKIARLIKGEVTLTPIYGSKGLWDGLGKWARKYDECVECNTNLYRHYGNGICIHCYEKFAYQNLSKEERDKRVAKLQAYYERMKGKKRANKSQMLDIISEVINDHTKRTPIINNLLANLHTDDFSILKNLNKSDD